MVKVNKEAPYGYKKDGTPRKVADIKSGDRRGAHKIQRGRKKGVPNKSSMRLQAEANTVMRMMAMGASKITNKRNKELGLKKNIPLSLVAACRELGISSGNVTGHIRRNPDLQKQYLEFRENRQEMLRCVSEDNITKGVSGDLDLSDKDMIDLSLKVLEKTDKAYNPKVEIEQTTKSLNFNIDIKDLERQFQELITL